MALETLKIKVFGLVQGVSFRFYAKDKAQELKIKGWVRNEPDGSVLILAQGEKENLREFINWCHQGSPLAQVEKVEVEKLETKEIFKDFSIRFN